MKKTLLVFFSLLTIVFISKAQDNVGIGTNTPHSSAVLELSATDMGLLVPRVTLQGITNATSPINGPATGLLVYNSAGTLTTGFYYWDGAQWVEIGAGGAATCVTLDEAYDCGGNGAGRVITADNGEVEITLPSTGTSNSAMEIYSDKASTWALGSENTSTGVAVLGVISGTTNNFNALQGSSFSNFNSGGGLGSGGVAGFYEGTGDGVGVYGGATNASSLAVAGVFGYNPRTAGGSGVHGQGYFGVLGEGVTTTTACYGLVGLTELGVGGQGETNDIAGYGLVGWNHYTAGTTGDGIGVLGIGGTGVWGETVEGAGYGVLGLNTGTTGNGIGVYGEGFNGVVGFTTDLVNGWAVFGDGDIGSSGTKLFVIDHPQDPGNKYLRHFCVESPEILNIYRGIVAFNANGEAIVELPDYFESINTNFSYQLTPVGAPANLYIKQKIENGRFVIAGGQSGMEVSWVVYAERNDALLQQYPEKRAVVKDKETPGTYLNPELYGQPEEKSVFSKPNSKEVKKLNTEDTGKVKKMTPFKATLQ
jgi:hypothetical protein